MTSSFTSATSALQSLSFSESVSDLSVTLAFVFRAASSGTASFSGILSESGVAGVKGSSVVDWESAALICDPILQRTNHNETS